MKKLMLIDGNSLLFRAYYATAYGNPAGVMRSKDGIPTNAIFALGSILIKWLETNHPDYAVVAFDTAAPTLRHQKYDQYKAGRPELPQDLITQFPLARELFVHLGFKVHEQEGYEADDIIGTMASQGEIAKLTTEIYSGDRDLLQLISPNTTVYLTKKGLSELLEMNPQTLLETYQLVPSQVPDFKGLMGDPSDNIPGIPGVGEKTALKLLATYHTMEEILNADIKGKIGETIKANKEMGRFSKEMATIIRDMPLPFSVEDTRYRGIDKVTLSGFFQRYEMQFLARKLAIPLQPNKTTAPLEILAQFNPSDFVGPCSLNIEVEGENYHLGTIHGFALACATKSAFIPLQVAMESPLFKSFVEHPTNPFLSEDIKRLYVAASRVGFTISSFRGDVTLAAFLLNPVLKDDPAAVFSTFEVDVISKNQVYGKVSPSSEQIAAYAIERVNALQKIEDKIVSLLTEKQLLNIYTNVDLPLALVLAKMELNGVRLDVSLLGEMSSKVAQKIADLEKTIYQLAGHSFNLNSPTQMGTILFDELQLPSGKKRSTAAEVLEFLKDSHPIIAPILEYRRYAKLQSTYLQSLPTYVREDGKIHTMFQQALVATGRISSKEPNLQNITVRDEEAKEVRRAIIAHQEGWSILSMDYSQIELRVLASLANAKSMIDAFSANLDIHTETAMKVFGVTKEAVTSAMRRQAKAVNFGIVYGISDWGLAEQLQIPPAEAKFFIQRYFETYPEIKTYLDQTVRQCEQEGFVKTILGRIRYVPEINEKNYNLREFGKRIAMNSPIQGSAAEIIKLAMVQIQHLLEEKKFRTKMILQVHDELVFDVPYEELNRVIGLIKSAMTNAYPMKVPMEVEYHFGHDWFHE